MAEGAAIGGGIAADELATGAGAADEARGGAAEGMSPWKLLSETMLSPTPPVGIGLPFAGLMAGAPTAGALTTGGLLAAGAATTGKDWTAPAREVETDAACEPLPTTPDDEPPTLPTCEALAPAFTGGVTAGAAPPRTMVVAWP